MEIDHGWQLNRAVLLPVCSRYNIQIVHSNIVQIIPLSERSCQVWLQLICKLVWHCVHIPCYYITLFKEILDIDCVSQSFASEKADAALKFIIADLLGEHVF